MAKVVCYDPQGKEYIKEPVDARECVEHCGFTMVPPEVKAADAPVANDGKTAKSDKGKTAKSDKG